MSISPFLIYKSSVLYLVIPILFFFLGWLRLGIGLFLSALLLLASVSFLKSIKSLVANDDIITLSKEHFIAFVILFLFLLSTGNTGLIGCWGTDIPWRNAIYQDLIRQPWPVIYDYSQSMLCYYITFWLVPANITAILGLNETGSNVVLLLWMYIGLLLIFFLLCNILKPKKEQVILITVIFLFFSGINTIGMILKSLFLEPTPLIADFPGKESWSFSDYNIKGTDVILIIRNTYLNLADVYNQFFAIAIATLLFYRFRAYIEYYFFVGLLVLPYSPIGFIGLFTIEFLEIIFNFLKNKKMYSLKKYIQKSASIVNISTVLALVPVYYLYYSMNIHASSTLNISHSLPNNFFYISWGKFSGDSLITLLIMLFFYYYLYFLIYARLIYDSYKKESVFWEILLCLFLFPFFKIGNSADFNFTATICPYLILCVLIINHLLLKINTKNFRAKDIILISCLSIAMLTPLTQIATSFRCAYLNDSISYKWTPWNPRLQRDSFKDKDVEGFSNFLAKGYADQFFYSYLSKRSK